MTAAEATGLYVRPFGLARAELLKLRKRRGLWLILSLQTTSSKLSELSPKPTKKTLGAGSSNACGLALAAAINVSRTFSTSLP